MVFLGSPILPILPFSTFFRCVKRSDGAVIGKFRISNDAIIQKISTPRRCESVMRIPGANDAAVTDNAFAFGVTFG